MIRSAMFSSTLQNYNAWPAGLCAHPLQ